MSLENDIQHIELYIEDAKKFVEAGKSVERLQKNRDFKKIIEEGYFRDEAVRLVSVKSDPSLQSPEKQEAIIKAIDAIGSLQGYIRTILQQASVATDAIAQAEEELASIEAGDE